MNIVSQTELALRLGKTPQTIINYEKQGLISRLNLPGAKYDFEECQRRLNKDYNANFEIRRLNKENQELRVRNKQLKDYINSTFESLKQVKEML